MWVELIAVGFAFHLAFPWVEAKTRRHLEDVAITKRFPLTWTVMLLRETDTSAIWLLSEMSTQKRKKSSVISSIGHLHALCMVSLPKKEAKMKQQMRRGDPEIAVKKGASNPGTVVPNSVGSNLLLTWQSRLMRGQLTNEREMPGTPARGRIFTRILSNLKKNLHANTAFGISKLDFANNETRDFGFLDSNSAMSSTVNMQAIAGKQIWLSNPCPNDAFAHRLLFTLHCLKPIHADRCC